jgi:SAM-dependent methyltransferase
MTCPLCREPDCAEYARLDRLYWHCPTCDLVFVDPSMLPSASRERAEYALHDNRFDDPGYRDFLAQIANPLLERVPTTGTKVLDYGCGPTPVLAEMLRDSGMEVSAYDPFFAPDGSLLERRYEVVTCTEVAEHFHDPAEEFERLATLLRPGGCLAVMTSLRPRKENFAGWHYRRDITHVVFYSERSMRWIASRHGWRYEQHSPRVHFFLNVREPAHS